MTACWCRLIQPASINITSCPGEHHDFDFMGAILPVVFLYWIVPRSRGFSIVIVEQATESRQPATLLRSALKVLESLTISADRVSAHYAISSTGEPDQRE